MKVSTDSLSVLACQIDIPESLTASARDQHLKSLHEKIAKTLDDSPANLIVLPELSSIDYSRESFERLDVLGEDLDGASVETWRKLARNYNCHVAFSFPRRAADSTYRITLAVVNPDGELIGHYDKIYLAQFGASMEKDYFVPGDTPLVFAIGSFVIAPIICADIRFPEFCRSLTVDHDVDAILHCGAYYRDESFYSWHSFAETRATTFIDPTNYTRMMNIYCMSHCTSRSSTTHVVSIRFCRTAELTAKTSTRATQHCKRYRQPRIPTYTNSETGRRHQNALQRPTGRARKLRQ